MTAAASLQKPAILYIASRLPALSETFVYRELFGLRTRGRSVFGASVRRPHEVVADPALASLAREVFIVYSARTAAVMPLALLRHPSLALQSLGDALQADHRDMRSRLKHVFQAAMGLALGWRLRNLGIRHVHAHMANVPTTVGLYIARSLGARFSFTGHAADLFVQRSGLHFKLNQADFVASISTWHQQFYNGIAAIGPDRAPVIRCSVAMPSELHDLGQEIVTVSRLVPKKGIDLLIRAFAAADLPGWGLRILGDGPERPALELLAKSLGSSDRITFEGPQPHARCLDAIAKAGMFVLPCRIAENGDKDGIPVALMEAMAAGRPVIGGDLPTIRELIEDDETGLLVEPNSEGSLVAAMRLIATDGGLARRLGSNARAFVEREFSDGVNLDRLGAALDRAETAG